MKIKRSYLLAAGMMLALAGWVASGHIGGQTDARHDAPLSDADTSSAPAASLPRVQVRETTASVVSRDITVNGKTAPWRSVDLRAETGGRVIEVAVERGSVVKQGQLLIRLDARERQAMVDQGEAMLRMRKIELDAALQLGAKGFQAETQVAAAEADFEAAKAALEQAQITLDHTEIRAPFDGVLEARPVEIGTFIDVGDHVATLIDQDPYLVVGDITEREVGFVHAGMQGVARLVTGEQIEGVVRYVASQSDEATRTFRVELEVPNPDGRFSAGVSAGLTIGADDVLAHQVSPSILGLNDAGEVGVKTLDSEDRVVFNPVEIVESDAESVWISGLPKTVRLITVGQGFVEHGAKVQAVQEEQPAAAGALLSEARS